MCDRGYANHADSETDSDGDGGSRPKLGGRGDLEFSAKGIPHGILHFMRQIKLAGHIYMHDVTAPEAAHRFNVQRVMHRVRMGTDYETSTSAVNWTFEVRTWAKIIDMVNEPVHGKKRTQKRVETLTAQFHDSNLLAPTGDVVDRHGQFTFSPLRNGGDELLCNDARLSYHELGTLVSRFTGWDLDFVLDTTTVQLYCSALVMHPGGERRTYWSTDSRYRYNGGSRRDCIEVDLGQGRSGSAEITAFVKMYGDIDRQSEGVLVRWMDKSSLSTLTDGRDRPLCPYPLSSNHCLWEWSDTGRDRASFGVRGFRNKVDASHLWSHVEQQRRADAIDSEIRARYDILSFDSIRSHVNIHVDPSTGHMLQTLQIV